MDPFHLDLTNTHGMFFITNVPQFTLHTDGSLSRVSPNASQPRLNTYAPPMPQMQSQLYDDISSGTAPHVPINADLQNTSANGTTFMLQAGLTAPLPFSHPSEVTGQSHSHSHSTDTQPTDSRIPIATNFNWGEFARRIGSSSGSSDLQILTPETGTESTDQILYGPQQRVYGSSQNPSLGQTWSM